MADTDDKIDPTILELHAKLCRTMAHPLRLALLNALRNGERTVGDLGQAVGAKQPLVSQHLAVLRNQGLLHYWRNGNEVYNSIAYPKTLQACDLLREVLFEHLQAQRRLLATDQTPPSRIVAPSAGGRQFDRMDDRAPL